MALSIRSLVLSAIVAATAGASAAAAAPAFPLTSTSVELPNSDHQFPPGPGVDAVNANCLTCHSAGMVLTQPALKKAAWEGEVQKMIKVYKAPVADADVAAIVGYLAATKGAN